MAGELLATGRETAQQHLAARLLVTLEQRHRVSTQGQDARGLESGRPAADHGDALRYRCRPDRVLAFTSRGGVHETDDRQAARMHVAASLIAGDAGADLVRSPVPSLCRELRIRVQGAAEGHEIRGSRFDQVFGHAGVRDPAGDAHGNVDVLAHLARERREHALRHLHRLRDPPVGLVHPRRDVDEVDACGLQVRGHPANVLDRDAVVHVLVAAQPIDDRHVRADRVAYGAHDFQRKPHAPREIAPVFVVALVAMGREELAQQIPVRTVNADEVAARLTGADRGIGEALDDLGDLVATQGARGRSACTGVRHDRGRARLQTAHRRVHDASAVVQLGPDASPVPMYRVGQPAQVGNQVVAVESHLQLAPAPARIDVRGLRIHRAHAPPCTRLQIVDVALRDAPLGRAVVALHRRGDDAISDFQRADPAGLKKVRKAHGGDSTRVRRCGTSVDRSTAALSRVPNTGAVNGAIFPVPRRPLPDCLRKRAGARETPFSVCRGVMRLRALLHSPPQRPRR